MNRKPLIVLLGGLALLVVFFLFANLRLARSQMNVEHSVSSYRFGKDLPESMQGQPYLAYTVSGPGWLAGALRRSLMDDLDESELFGQVELLEEAPENFERPYLLVTANRPRLFWTPFFVISSGEVSIAYASNGDIAILDEDVIEYTSDVGRALSAEGTFTYRDVSFGLLPLAGYYDLLADQLSGHIQKAVTGLYVIP